MRNYIIILLLLSSFFLKAQDIASPSRMGFDFGLGFGLDYGGIGIRGTFQPTDRLGLFCSAGYNLNALGTNTGVQWHFPSKRHDFFLTGMYGYNAVLVVTGTITDKATYYGATVGAGYQIKMNDNGNFWNFELLVPFRNSNFQDDYDALKGIGANPDKPLPVAFSIGYHFKFK